MIVVSLAKALICFSGQCHPALIGADTPVGDFPLIERRVLAPGYGGDVLQFKQDSKGVYAIHRVWLGVPSQRRMDRFGQDANNRTITAGCINITPDLYEELKSCCRQHTLRIIP